MNGSKKVVFNGNPIQTRHLCSSGRDGGHKFEVQLSLPYESEDVLRELLHRLVAYLSE